MLAKRLMGGTAVGVYVEDVFSTFLYTGTDAAQTITNGVNLAGDGGFVWIKNRVNAAAQHAIYDTARGAQKRIISNTSDSEFDDGALGVSFGLSGFNIGGSNFQINNNGNSYVSWTLRKQQKFFDVVTWTGNGVTGRQITHNLGSTPGCVIVKRRNGTGNWIVSHRFNESSNLRLNTDAAAGGGWVYGLSPTTFTVWADAASLDSPNTNGGTYVAYLFAHNAGGFGRTGTDNVISCGSFTTDGSGSATVNHGFVNGAQFCVLKAASTTGDWEMYDDKRTPSWSSSDARLRPNLANAEDAQNRLSGSGTSITFANLSASQTYIYILIASP